MPTPTAIRQVGNKLQLFGITNQEHDDEIYGDIVFYSAADGTTVLNGTAFLNLQQVGLTDSVEEKASKNQAGANALFIFHNQELAITVTAIPEGATLTSGTPVDAILSCKIGPAGSFCKLENFPIIAAFGQTDIFNSSDWLYHGNAELTALADDRWGMTFRLVRHIGGGISKQAAR